MSLQKFKNCQKHDQLFISPKAPRHTARSPRKRKDIFPSRWVDPRKHSPTQIAHPRGCRKRPTWRPTGSQDHITNTQTHRHTHTEINEIQNYQRLNKYQEPTAKLDSKAHCYTLGEECDFHRAILNHLRRQLRACWEPVATETGTKASL